jgi:hypothetical protein
MVFPPPFGFVVHIIVSDVSIKKNLNAQCLGRPITVGANGPTYDE